MKGGWWLASVYIIITITIQFDKAGQHAPNEKNMEILSHVRTELQAFKICMQLFCFWGLGENFYSVLPTENADELKQLKIATRQLRPLGI